MTDKGTGVTKKAVIYARVSTDEQTPQNQIGELKSVATRMGWDVIEIYVDQGISGVKGREKRPAYDEMYKSAIRREFDVIMSWSVDRLGRSLQNLVSFLADIHAKGIDLYLHQQGIDTTTPAGKAMFQMCGVFAEFERAMIQERVKAGLSRAKAQGKVLGRPKVSLVIEKRVTALRKDGKGIKTIAKEVGVGVGTVQRIVRELNLDKVDS